MRLLWVAVSLLLVTAVAPAAEPRPEALVLGRADLPKGYEVGDDTACGSMGVEGYPPGMAQIILAHRPHPPRAWVTRICRPWAGKVVSPGDGMHAS